ncbi:MAG: hypothetical protein E7057_09860 [Lentisphaerae bacterium]|nr:hypothetical protein [Lentisphaerota bacterium]
MDYNCINLSLDGEWDFFYSPQPFDPETSSLPDSRSYTGKMVTPGYWDDHYELFDEEDFFGLTARFNPDYRKPHFPMGRTLLPHAASSFLIGTGYYRKRFAVPEKFSCTTLTVGPAMWGCCVYCNGKFSGKTTGYSTASTYILDELLIPGKENELIIAVCNYHDDGGAYHRLDKSHDGTAYGTRPGQHRGLAAQGYQSERGGINNGVSLKLSSGAQFTDYFISFADGVPLWHLETRGGKAQLEWQISRQGKTVDSGTSEIDRKLEFTSAVPPVLWSDRDPVLYDIELTLKCKNQITDKVVFRWGAGKLSVNKMTLELNGIPTFLRGLTEHCYFADTANPHCDKEKYLRELGVLRRAGFNFIRCHTWCPPEEFYLACDELGFIVQTELPSVWSFEEAEAVIRQIRRHSCAMIFCEGNEKLIDEPAIIRLQKLADMLHDKAPGMLFNPQEAMRGVEYELTPGRKISTGPLVHDIERLNRIREFADCFGTLGGEFSYNHDHFPGREFIEQRNAVYQRPCLNHEAGILGGYLDFSVEERYKGTFIGTDMFEAAREHMTRHGVYQNARKYYEKNSLFISACRKQLIENLRSCRNMAGFDYLGGIDTHWHLIGYPCGIFNEFYEEKFGETIADVRKYCDENILLCTAGNRRNFHQGKRFAHDIEAVCYTPDGMKHGILRWSLAAQNGKTVFNGELHCPEIVCGQIASAGKIEFTFPETGKAEAYTLYAELTTDTLKVENSWEFWSFPQTSGEIPCSNVKIVSSLSEDVLDFIAGGGRVLLTGNFPGTMNPESFRSQTSGRSLGHAGALINPHPLWEKFPHTGFLNWQFFKLMDGSKSLIYDRDMPEFKPVFELIPSFKMVKHKAMLAEFSVGEGRLMVCGFSLDNDDPAAEYMRQALIEYLSGELLAVAPVWEYDALQKRVRENISSFAVGGKAVDAGGRPVE